MYDVEHIRHRIMTVIELLAYAREELDGIHGQLEHEEEDVARPPRVWQRDIVYGHKQFTVTSSETFGSAGCLVCCAYSVARLAGFVGTVEAFAGAIDEAEAFRDGELVHHAAVCRVEPALRWYTSPSLPGDYASFVDWSGEPANIAALDQMLSYCPVVVQVDFVPATRVVDRHYVVAYQYCPSHPGGLIEDDLFVMDPWTGTYGSILTYFNPAWLRDGSMPFPVTKVQRTVYGARVWEIRQ